MYESDFYNVLVNAGYSPQAPLIADGEIHRFPVDGDSGAKRSGWYVQYSDTLIGNYGNWRSREKHTWHPEKGTGSFDNTEWREKRRQQQEEFKKRQAEKHRVCREECKIIWDSASLATDDHPYLLKKKVQAHGIRLSENRRLIVPLWDSAGLLHGVQYIAANSFKQFHKNCDVSGHYLLLGTPDSSILIAEGFATAATLHEISGHAVAVSFGSTNLKAVAEILRTIYSEIMLVVCGDDDRNIPGNPGITKATEAARAVGGRLTIPVFTNPDTRGTDFNDLHKAEGAEAVRSQLAAALLLPDTTPGGTVAEMPKSAASETLKPREPVKTTSLFISAAEFLNSPFTVDYLINRLIERDTTGQIFGPSKGGKTFNVLDWSLNIATGGTVNGNRVSQGLVLYLAGEGHGGLKRRVRAWKVHHGVTSEDLRLFHLSRNTISFDGSGLDAAVSEARELVKFHGMPIALIVIDTLARHLEGDESNTRDMIAFIKSVDTLRASFPGAVALIVHHSGHGEETKMRGRGSSALRAAMDFEIHCDKGQLTFTKMKDAEMPEPIFFKLRPVVIGQDPDGEPKTSCIVEYGERAERHQESNFTVMERLALKVLILAAANPKTNINDNGKWGALIGDWRKAFYAARLEQDAELSQNTLKQAFNRAAEGLIAKQLVAEHLHVRIPVEPRNQEEILFLMRQAVQGTQMVLVPECTGQ